MKKGIARVVDALLIVGMSGIGLVTFVLIWLKGGYFLHEPNLIYRTAETSAFALILIYGIARFILSLRQ